MGSGSPAADRPEGRAFATRSVVFARHGMVAAAHPLAVQIGVDTLKKGGSAVDAAIAANAAIGLMQPVLNGIGGDLFAIVWDAKTKKLFGLNASGRSPYKATRELFASKGLKEIPTFGPLSWSVPGCVDGWEQLNKKFGTMNLEEILAPSIGYAEKGFPVSETIAKFWANAAKELKKTLKANMRRLSELDPLVKEAVKEVVSKTDGSATLNVKEMKDTIDKAVKEAVRERVGEMLNETAEQ